MQNQTASLLVNPKYRADIDGLRAIAVLAVVAFHAFPHLDNGVFICLDIFFVISGFLISSIIFKSLGNNSFSFAEFYARRIRRIFPSLIVVLIAVYVVGWFVLFSDEYKRLAQHLAGGAFFLSNFVFMDEVNYFNTEATTKPLLHLWSLSVEEQFYIIWPLLLYFSWKSRNKFSGSILATILFFMLSSFIYNIYIISQSTMLAYYSTVARGWEFLIGAWLAYNRISTPNPVHSWYSNYQSFIGILLIVFGIFYIDKYFAFPGWWALFPTVGAALIIAANDSCWFNRVILSNKVLVWFGLISLPLYLWHWPMLIFSRIMTGEELPAVWSILIVAGAVFLSWLTYEFVEKPMRFGKYLKVKTMSLLITIFILGYIGILTFFSNGVPTRDIVKKNEFNDKQIILQEYYDNKCSDLIGFSPEFCTVYGNKHNIKYAVIGDSVANALAAGVASVYANENDGVINIGMSRCLPLRGLDGKRSNPNNPNLCPETVDKTYEYLLSNHSIKTVFMSGWFGNVKHLGVKGIAEKSSNLEIFDKLKTYIDYDISKLKSTGKNVFFSFDMPLFDKRAVDCLERPFFYRPYFHNCEFEKDALNKKNPDIGLFEEFFKNRTDICILRVSDILLKQDKYRFMDDSGKLMLMDDHHLSPHGAEKLIKSANCH